MRRVSRRNGIKRQTPTTLVFRCLPSTILFSFKDYLPATMGRRALSQEDRYTLAQKRGYSAQSTSDRQTLLSQTEQRPLAGATKDKHESVDILWKEYVKPITVYRFTNGDN